MMHFDRSNSGAEPRSGPSWLIFHAHDASVIAALAFSFSSHPAIRPKTAVATSNNLFDLAFHLGLNANAVPGRAITEADEILAAVKANPRLRVVIVRDGLVNDPIFSKLEAVAPSDQFVFLRGSDLREYPEHIIDGIRAFAWLPEEPRWRENSLTTLKAPIDNPVGNQKTNSTQPRVALTWWGTWPYSQVTVGDTMSVAALAAGLRRRGVEFHIVHRERCWVPTYRIPGCEDSEVLFDDIDPQSYKVCVFICGPLPTDWPEGEARLLAFGNASRLAVGTTLSKPSSRSPAERVFHGFLARDGFQTRWMDLSLSCDWPIALQVRNAGKVALCLRGTEPYFEGDDASAPVEALIELAVRRKGFDVVRLSTVAADSETDWIDLDAQFGRPAAVVTTRLHGCLLSLRHGTPFIAVDQIVGGKKVRAINEQIGWPLSFSAEDLSLGRLEEALGNLQLKETGARLERGRQRAILLSEATQNAAIDWIERALNR
jgi:Polysaccharide pyruvyl transferase